MAAPPKTAALRIAGDDSAGNDSARTLSLLVIARDQLDGTSLCALLAKSPSISTQYASSEHADHVALLDERPDAVIWLADHVGANTLRRIEVMRDHVHRPKVCLLVRQIDSQPLRDLLAGRGSEGLAVLLRSSVSNVRDILRTVLLLIAGRVTLTPHVLDELLAESPSRREEVLRRLTPREESVLALLALGLRNYEIARRLGCSEKSVEGRVGRIFAKLELNAESERGIDRRVRAAHIYESYAREEESA